MEMAHNYDGQGLKGALWTVAGTAIANTAQNFLSGGCGGGLLGGLFKFKPADAEDFYKFIGV